MATIAFLVPYSKYYAQFSWDLLHDLSKEGHEIIALAPDDDFRQKLASIGVQFVQVPLNNTGMNPFYDMYSLYKLVQSLRKLKPQRVMCYSIKPVLYGSLASRLAGVKQVAAFITGVGFVFIDRTLRRRMLLLLVQKLYKASLRYADKIFFENPDDLALFQSMQLIGSGHDALLVNGSGVNVEAFAHTPPPSSPISFIIVARMLRDKGIMEYIEAAGSLKSKYPDIRFKILGPFVRNPSSIKREVLMESVAQGIVEYLGETRDVRPYLSQSSVFVLPSYREGTPKSALEAMAMGLPVITTDCPGCRETVQNHVNGLLVPPRDSRALADAMETFILHPELIEPMGQRSRELAVGRFDVRKVNDFIKQSLGLTP